MRSFLPPASSRGTDITPCRTPAEHEHASGYSPGALRVPAPPDRSPSATRRGGRRDRAGFCSHTARVPDARACAQPGPRPPAAPRPRRSPGRRLLMRASRSPPARSRPAFELHQANRGSAHQATATAAQLCGILAADPVAACDVPYAEPGERDAGRRSPMARRRTLAERRRALGYSQEALAEKLGIDRTTVGRWERGETDPY